MISLPVGPSYGTAGGFSYALTLTYNSNVWDFQDDLGGNGYIQGLPGKHFNAGFGWNLSLGRLYVPTDPRNDSGVWNYIGPDGAEHFFYPTLHEGETTVAGRQYTRDGSYLRLRDVTTGQKSVEFPDGRTHLFTFLGGQTGFDWLLTRISDPHGNFLNVSYTANSWQLTDNWGRSHSVSFTSVPQYGQAVSSVALAAFNGTTVSYNFAYTSAAIARACPDNDPQTGNVTLPFLTAVTLPDGSQYQMPLADYDTTVPAGLACSPYIGRLLRMTLPTRGQLEWTYQTYHMVSQNASILCNQFKPQVWLEKSIGVATRTVRQGAVTGTWTYGTSIEPSIPLDPFGTCHQPSRERQTSVTSPLGDRTVHYFSMAGFPSDGWRPEEYGLPLTHYQADGTGTRFLSSQVFDLNPANGQQELKRSTYVRYEMDRLPASLSDDELWHYNRRVASQRTVYHDDGGRVADEDRSLFDGLGHYRQTVTGGTFGAGDVRTTVVQWNPAAGEYRADSSTVFNLPGANAPWLLETSSEVTTTEGGSSSKVQLCFNGQTGFLERRRVYKTGTAAGARDLVSVYTNDGRGNVASEQYFGGDVGTALGTAVDVCSPSFALPANQFRIDHTHPDPARPGDPWRRTSQYVNAAGSPLSFKVRDEEIDPNTGLVRLSRDGAGLATSFEYDPSGRLTWEMPETGHDGWTERFYTSASPTAGASILVRRRANGSKSAVVQSQSLVVFDGLGRLAQEQQRLPGGAWSVRETRYDGAGNRTWVSELQSGTPTKATQFLDFDAFGRPRTVRPPDGSGHDVTLSYAGVRSVSRTAKVGTTWNGTAVTESSALTTETYDRQGRLWQVSEPAGAGGAQITTIYSYDVGNRLKQASTTAAGATQIRTFTYDNRGFLTSESHPEKGAAVAYSNYDARGHAGRRVDGPNDLTFVFDRAERLTQVRETGGLQRPLKTFAYAAANGSGDWKNGKLEQQSRFNYVVVNGGPFKVEIRERFVHGGRGGRVSSRVLENWVNDPMTPNEAFSQTFSYDVLGNLRNLGYPQCTHAACTAPTPRTVQFNYTEGLLSSVTGYASSITYHPNLLVHQVTHANNVIDTQANDPNAMRRPASIQAATSTGTVRWSTGNYSYDGSANVTRIGPAWFTYDRVSRLTAGSVNDGTTGAGVQRQQSYAFDPFGNITAITTGATLRNTPTSSATNRLTGGLYDTAGNLTSWNGSTYTYDAFNQMWSYRTATDEWVYLYGADDERAWIYKTDGTDSRWFLRDLAGRVLREYGTNSGVWRVDSDSIYRDGLLLAAETPAGVRHFHLDHLGTPRLVTDSLGQQKAYHVYYPFGEEATAFNQDTLRLKFTGHERDLGNPGGAGDDLDYMHARHCSPLTGRFLSVDPGAARPGQPQSWNRYSYALGNPLRYVDPDGRESEEAGLFATLYKFFSAGLNWLFPPPPVHVDPTAQALAEEGEISSAQAYRLSPGAAANLTQQGLNDASATLGAGAAYIGIQAGTVKSLAEVTSLLRPGGSLIGTAGSSSRIRFLSGGQDEALQLFSRLTSGGQIVRARETFTVVVVPGVGQFTYRTVSSTEGVVATIDVFVRGIGIQSLKFLPK